MITELNTKKGVLLTTYSKIDLEKKIQEFNDNDDQKGCEYFLSNIRTFNLNSDCPIEKEEAAMLVGVEGTKKAETFYTNYKGYPFGFSINEAKLYFTDPVRSLRSAFEIMALYFDFKKDFFHIQITE